MKNVVILVLICVSLALAIALKNAYAKSSELESHVKGWQENSSKLGVALCQAIKEKIAYKNGLDLIYQSSGISYSPDPNTMGRQTPLSLFVDAQIMLCEDKAIKELSQTKASEPVAKQNVTPKEKLSKTQANKPGFYSLCAAGEAYCICLYDVLHRISPGREAENYAEGIRTGNNASMVNAYAECNNKFNSH